MEEYLETGTCCLCGGTYTHWGNNPDPLCNPYDMISRCCDKCNAEKVLPARIRDLANIKAREHKARRELATQGYILQKHINTVNPYHFGCYQIVNGFTNAIETGENFDLTLEDVENFIKE